METLRFEGKNVYLQLQLRDDFSVDDLRKAHQKKACIRKAYFFELNGDREVRKVLYDRQKVKDWNSALMLEVESWDGTACMTLAGLEKVISFLSEASIPVSDVPYLTRRDVQSYYLGLCLIGISIENTYGKP